MENIFTQGAELPISGNLPISTEEAVPTNIAVTTPKVEFDFDGAIQAGYQPEEIIAHLEQTSPDAFDYQGAIQAGYQPAEIIDHLKGPGVPKAPVLETKIAEPVESPDTRMKDFVIGIRQAWEGVEATTQDAANMLGLIPDEDYAEMDRRTQSNIRQLGEYIKDKDFFSTATLGQITPTILSLPVAYQTKVAAALIEASIGYTEARGVGATKGEAAATGAIAGGATAGIMKIIEKFGPKAAEGTYQYYRNQLNYTQEEADAIFKDWSKTMDTDGSSADKLRSLVDYAGDKGAQIKADLAKVSPSAQKNIDAGRATRIREVGKLIDADVGIDDIAIKVNDQIDIVKDNYTKVKWEINNKVVPTKGDPITIPDALEEIATDRSAIKELLGNADATVHDLIDAMPHVNEILRKVKGTHLNDWSNLKTKVDTKIKESLAPADYAKWKEVNADYSHMATVKNSKLGEAVIRATGKAGKKSQIEPSRVLELIKADKDSGVDTFQSIQKLLGNQDTAKLEQMIIKDAFGQHADDLSWNTLSSSLAKKGFVSAEGKQLQDLIENISKSFRTDDALKAVSQRMQQDQGGIGKNLLEKFQISLAGRVFRMILKMGPTEGAKGMRMADRLADILKNPSQMKKINKAVSELGTGIKARMVEETLQDLPKLIEYKPRAVPFTKTNEPLYVTPKGAAVKGSEVSKAVQAEDLTEWIRNTKLSDTDANKVIDAVHKITSDVRIDKILTSVNKKLKADDAIGNAKLVAKTIEAEANIIAKRISQDAGVRLSQKDTQGLAHMLFKRYVEGCE